MYNQISIVWFRQDLRLSDNPALAAASELGEIIPIYIFDNSISIMEQPGSTSKVWLHHSLHKLNESLRNNLNVYLGNPQVIIKTLINQYDIKNIFLNRCYEPWNIDDTIQKALLDLKVKCHIFNGSYLWKPQDITKKDGSYYRVFTAYKKKALLLQPRKAVKTPEDISLIKDQNNKYTIEALNLLPSHQWYQKIETLWEIGENAAQKKLNDFIKNKLSGYKNGRDYPAYKQISQLSPHLHFGEISPVQILESINAINAPEVDIQHFISEVIWREFSCYLLSHFKGLGQDNFQNKFNSFPWQNNDSFLKAWQTGKTGYPIIDAGMRELWQTGYMHNRVRMIVASFLVKNLMIHWHKGRDWFWDSLVDADFANNSASWQWVAGCGADAAPYFRIFNPIIQGEKFDQKGTYTRKFVPELKFIPNQFLFKPWMAPVGVLREANVILGINYPKPIVDISQSREVALNAYRQL